MATYGGAIDLILTELNRQDTSITAVVEREFLKAIESYAHERWWFNEARISFTASTTIYYPLANLSATILEIDQLSVTINSSNVELEEVTHQAMHRMDVSGQTGAPSHWALFAEQIRLYPKPATATTYQVDLMGTKKLATLSASTDTNAWTTEALNLIAARTEKVVCARKFKDFEAAQMYQVAEDQEYAKLRDRAERLQSTGKLSGGY